jgi:HSP20 family protein
MEVEMMLMRTDPFRDLDRLTQQVFGTTARPALMAMDAWRDQDKFVVEFDLPGIDVDSIDLDVERNVLTVRADRPAREGIEELVAAERPRGVFSRQLMLGDTLDADRISASYQAGVLRLEIPVAEKSKPRKITVNSAEEKTAVTASADQGAVNQTQDQNSVHA